MPCVSRPKQPTINGLNKPLIVEVVEGVARKIQVVFRHDPKRADGGKSPAVFAVQLVHSVAINNQFALVAARQVDIPHQRFPRIVILAVARIARPPESATACVHKFVYQRRCSARTCLSGRYS
jgi:hypothetical protein